MNGIVAVGERVESAPGLSAAEVETRRLRGETNATPDRTSRRTIDIVRSNVVTRFNAILAALACVVLVFGEPVDALFAFVLVLNTAIGIVQEVRAKRTLDRLRILIAPKVTVRRGGAPATVTAGELVIDDVVLLSAGDQVPVDAVVLHAQGLEVDESALTGESEPVAKGAGDEVLSGSAVVAGSADVRAIRVGEHTWIHALVAQAKAFGLARSELRSGVDRILRIVSWSIVPLGALVLWSQLRSSASFDDGVVAAVAGVVGLIPQGLVLLVSLAMAVAIVRLAANHVVVQELYAVEGLARVDVLCVDKTGTLTTGKLAVESLEAVEVTDEEFRGGLAAMVAAETAPTATMQVLAPELPDAPDWKVSAQMAFSSARKWSATTFEGHGSWVFGAPEVLLDGMDATASTDATTATDALGGLRERVAARAEDGQRVMLLGQSNEEVSEEGALPTLRIVGLIALREEVRDDAASTMAYFAAQHVTVKVISGDNPRTVSAVARRVGVEGAERCVDMRAEHPPFDDVVNGNVVFGRVLPEQKRDLVEALQRAGHVVAMTGDGVNDIPALKRADIGIAMDNATAATKAVAQLVLLDGRFDRLPNVVAEGRRVIANMERVSSLFVTKTIYAAVFALVIGVSGSAFPFLPRHISLVSELTIGIPAFVLSFRAAGDPCRPGYLARVVRFAIPAGLSAAVITLGAYWLARSELVDSTLAEARTVSTLVLIVAGFVVLVVLMLPIDAWDALLLAGLLALFGAILATPALRRLYALELSDRATAVAVGSCALVTVIAMLTALRHRSDRR